MGVTRGSWVSGPSRTHQRNPNWHVGRPRALTPTPRSHARSRHPGRPAIDSSPLQKQRAARCGECPGEPSGCVRRLRPLWTLSLLLDGTPPCEGGSSRPGATAAMVRRLIVGHVLDRPPLKAVRPLRNRSAKPYGYPEGPWACDPLRHAAICCVTPLRHACRNATHGTVRMTPHAARRRFERGAAVGGWRGRYSRGSATTSQR